MAPKLIPRTKQIELIKAEYTLTEAYAESGGSVYPLHDGNSGSACAEDASPTRGSCKATVTCKLGYHHKQHDLIKDTRSCGNRVSPARAGDW